MYTFVQFRGTKPELARNGVGAGIPREIEVIGKEYFVRQAAILLGLAKATRDPKISAALLDKAADFKSQLDEPTIDRSPRAPDVQPEK
jgi:hypothetical protein